MGYLCTPCLLQSHFTVLPIQTARAWEPLVHLSHVVLVILYMLLPFLPMEMELEGGICAAVLEFGRLVLMVHLRNSGVVLMSRNRTEGTTGLTQALAGRELESLTLEDCLQAYSRVRMPVRGPTGEEFTCICPLYV